MLSKYLGVSKCVGPDPAAIVQRIFIVHVDAIVKFFILIAVWQKIIIILIVDRAANAGAYCEMF